MPIHDDLTIRRILKEARTIAVVGASAKPWRDSNSILAYLLQQQYKVFPVNPKYTEVLGIPCVPNLSSIPEKIDIVDIFRRPDALEPIVREAILVRAETIWMQVGVVNEAAAEQAERAGLNVIMDRCIRVDHQRLFR